MGPDHNYLIGFGQIFTLFFVMLGPLRLLGPYLEETKSLPLDQQKKLARQTGFIAFISIVIGSIIGEGLLKNWGIEIPILLLAGGIIFFLSALQPIIGIKPAIAPSAQPDLSPGSIAIRRVITPYGVVGVIVLLSASHDWPRYIAVLVCLGLVMFLNVLTMKYGHWLLQKTGPLPLKILGTVLGSLQLALALQMIAQALPLIRV